MALRLMDHGLEVLSRLKARAFFSLAQGQPPAPDGEIPILVYNPHPYPVSAVVECEFQLADQNWSSDYTSVQAYSRRAASAHPDGAGTEQSEPRLAQTGGFPGPLAPAQMNRFDCRLERLPQRPPLTQPKGMRSTSRMGRWKC
jgi:alpha-mannosidase